MTGKPFSFISTLKTLTTSTALTAKPPLTEVTHPEKNAVSLYFHIPFCQKRCHYCHFYTVPNREAFVSLWLEAIKKEWLYWKDKIKDKTLISIYFGGGTPSLLSDHNIHSILSLIDQTFPFTTFKPEITLEANPEDVTLVKMKKFAKVGINRVSIGVQTLNDQLLKKLGRLHNGAKALQAIEDTYLAGIKDISADLMFDLPEQTLSDWESTLQEIVQKPLTHISLYNLTIEPKTLFFRQKKELLKKIPNDETSYQMLLSTKRILEENSFNQYEISAFSRSGQYSQHNIGYWIGRPFIGLGPSAFSYWEGKRFQNYAHINRYANALSKEESAIDFSEELDPQAKIRELFTIRLRLCCGCNLASFEKEFGSLEAATKLKLQELKEQNLIEEKFVKDKFVESKFIKGKFIEGELIKGKGSTFFLSEKGRFFYDSVAAELI